MRYDSPMDYEPLPVPNPFGAPVYRVAETDSTMRLARELAGTGAADGTVIRADFQSAGRGRIEGRLWEAPRGLNLLATTILRRPPVRGFTLRVGLAAAKAVARFLPAGLEAKVKWPNDVLVSGRKVAGILCESDGGALYVGTGFNVRQTRFPPELGSKAASIASFLGEAPAPGPDEVLVAFLGELGSALSLDDWHERVSEILLYRGERIRFLQGDPSREEWLDGTVEGIGPDGELLFRPDSDPGVPACCAAPLRLFSGEIPYPGSRA